MFVPEELRTNAYRVLRSSASSTLGDLHRAAESMMRAAKLGVAITTDADIPDLGEVARAEVDIRGAVGRLGNPVNRLQDRAFWLHNIKGSRDAESPAEPSAIDSDERHDRALRSLFRAYADEADDSGACPWPKRDPGS